MYRKILNAVRVQATLSIVVWGFFFAITYHLCLSSGNAAVDSAAMPVSVIDSAVPQQNSSDSVPHHVLAENTQASHHAVTEESAVAGAETSTAGLSPANSGARMTFVKSASALRVIIGRLIAETLHQVSIPGLSGKKLLLFFGSILLILVTISFYRSHRERDRFMTTTRLSIMDKEVQRACRFVEDHYDDPTLDIRKICEALITGGAFLEALFVKELGLSIDDFIAQVRINRAKIMLRKVPDTPAADLAAMVGYSSEKIFADNFCAISGVGIEAYRKAIGMSGDAPE